jgi:hypothetical protein
MSKAVPLFVLIDSGSEDEEQAARKASGEQQWINTVLQLMGKRFQTGNASETQPDAVNRHHVTRIADFAPYRGDSTSRGAKNLTEFLVRELDK